MVNKSKKTPEANTIEMNIGRLALQEILEKHLNDQVLRTPHKVVEVITHKQGDFGLTVLVEPTPIPDSSLGKTKDPL